LTENCPGQRSKQQYATHAQSLSLEPDHWGYDASWGDSAAHKAAKHN